MKKAKSFIFLCLCLSFSSLATKAQSTVPLPKGTFISKGILTAKEGYQFFLSADKKTATLRNTKDNNAIEGGFSCDCTVSTPSGETCDLVLKGHRELSCVGSCGCRLDITPPNGGIKYSIFLKNYKEADTKN
jgi:hypothetical protein